MFSYLLKLNHQKENLAGTITIYISTFGFLEIQCDPTVRHKRLLSPPVVQILKPQICEWSFLSIRAMQVQVGI